MMKKSISILCLMVILTTCKGGKTNNTKSSVPANPADYAKTITQEELKTLLYKYASDEFEGRNTGEKGQKMAVEYLKSQYKSMGIGTPYSGDDYFQEVPLQKPSVAVAEV